MYKALIRTQLRAVFSGMFRGSRNAKKRGAPMKVLIVLFAVYVVGILAFNFGQTYTLICKPFFSAGFGWLYFAFVALLSFTLSFLMTVFQTQAMLFEAKDNDLLLSMPIPPRAILLSRIAGILIAAYAYQTLIGVPGVVVYFILYPFDTGMLVIALLALLLLPLLVMTFSCIFGWLCAMLNAKYHTKNLISVVMSVLFLAAYFYFFSKLQAGLDFLAGNAGVIAAKLRGVLPLYWFGSAIADKNAVSLLLFALCAILPLCAVIAVLGKSYARVAASAPDSGKKKVYREKTLAVASPRRALLRKELVRFGANPMYALNAVMGSFFMVVLAVAVLVKRGELLSYASAFSSFAPLPALACAALSALSLMNLTSAASVSIESKTLWLMHSLPVDTGDILMAKAWLGDVIGAPCTVITSVLLSICFRASLPEAVLMIVLPLILEHFTGVLGVAINVHFPKLDWINEVVAIKQSMSTFLCMMISLGCVIVPGLIYGFLLFGRISISLYLALLGVVFLGLTLLLERWLRTRGAALFDALN